MGASGAGANRAAALAQLRPVAVPVDQDAALVQDAVEKKRCVCLNPVEVSQINLASGRPLKTAPQIHSDRVARERHKQVQIGARIVIPPRKRAIENYQSNSTLGAESPAKTCQERPVRAKVLDLPRSQAQLAWTGAPSMEASLRHRATQGALVNPQIVCQLLDRRHIEPS